MNEGTHDKTVITFEAEIVLPDAVIDAAGGLELAVQNEIGHTVAALLKVTDIRDYPRRLIDDPNA